MSSQAPFSDHFSAVAADYAQARPAYPSALFDWIASAARARRCAWEAGCGSGQASRSLAARFASVHASDPSAAQIAQAQAPDNVRFVVEPSERCSLPDGGADAVCVAQALHWFDRAAFFAECARVLRPGGVLVAWGYQDIEPDAAIRAAVDAFRADIATFWPPERGLVDSAYAGFDWPFAGIDVPCFAMTADWPLGRLLGYLGSFSATKRFREHCGEDPVLRHQAAIAAAWGEPERVRHLRWPLFVHARRKSV